jgi:hypothetical protein
VAEETRRLRLKKARHGWRRREGRRGVKSGKSGGAAINWRGGGGLSGEENIKRENGGELNCDFAEKRRNGEGERHVKRNIKENGGGVGVKARLRVAKCSVMKWLAVGQLAACHAAAK